MTQVDLAKKIAMSAHDGQYRMDGVTPYITHPKAIAERVAQFGGNESTIATAWLHDVVEDTKTTLDDLRTQGVKEEIVAAVDLLTKKGDNVTMDELDAISKNDIAKLVKVCDMLHNLSDCPTRSQVIKYTKRLHRILVENFVEGRSAMPVFN